MLFGKRRAPPRFVEAEAFDRNLKRQLELDAQTLEELRKHGVSAESSFRLEFFFYTNSSDKAQALNSRLSAMGYQSHAGPSAQDKRILLVNGWTTPIAMDLTSVLHWTETMCQVGFEHDCEFDGWGTLLDQTQIPDVGPEQRDSGAGTSAGAAGDNSALPDRAGTIPW